MVVFIAFTCELDPAVAGLGTLFTLGCAVVAALVGGLGNCLTGDTALFFGFGSGNGLGFLPLEEDDAEDLAGEETERGRCRLGLSESDEDASLGDRLRTGDALRELERDLGLGRGRGGGDLRQLVLIKTSPVSNLLDIERECVFNHILEYADEVVDKHGVLHVRQIRTEYFGDVFGEQFGSRSVLDRQQITPFEQAQ